MEQYQSEVASIQRGLEAEVKTRAEGYKQALGVLNREFDLNENDFELILGGYDAERDMFPKATLRPRKSSSLDELSWPLIVQPKQAQKLKTTVENDAVKIRAKVNLDANRRRTEIEKVLIEDVVQGKTFGYPLNPGYRNAVLWRSVLVPGYGQFHAKKNGSGFLFLSSSIIVGAVTLAQYVKAVDAFRRYEDLVADYELAITEAAFQRINSNLNSTKKRWRIKRRQYYSALAVVGGIWSLNILDAATTNLSSRPSFSSAQSYGSSLSSLSFKFWPSVCTIKLRSFF